MTEPVRRVRGPARFREKDVVRIIKAARKANMAVAAVRIEPDGSILVIPGAPETIPYSGANPFDD